MAIIDPSVSFSNSFNAAQNVTDTFRKNMAFKALENAYGPIVGDMKLASDVQAYEHNELMNPLKVEEQQLTNESTRATNAFNEANRPLVLQSNQLANETSQFNLEQGRAEADRTETIRQAQQAHTMLGGVLNNVETALNGVVDPNQRIEVFDREVRQLAPLIGADPETLLHQLAQQRAAIAAQGSAAIGPMRQQLDDMLYAGLSPEERQKLVTGAIDQELKRAQIITEGAQAEKAIADAEKSRAEADEKAAEKVQVAKEATRALDDFEQKQQTVNTAIDEAIRLATRYPTGTGPQVALPGGNLLPGASDIAAQLQTIGANIGFDELQKLRAAGGTLGQVTEAEHKLLQSVAGTIAQDQTRGAFVAGLRRLKSALAASAKRARKAYDEDFGDTDTTGDDDAEVVDYTTYFEVE